ncbi:TspO/MBR family protein [Methanofollis sp. UBA420]|jgi:tryptophan-rich sensory protein|uniref:TspO/MBR family protein n=1 Tax=Methanofollis sp. UBA420 TaxID=1915514 RepID=UPI00316ADBFA
MATLSDPVRLVVSVALTLLAGFTGSIFTTPQIPGWYAGLVKSPLNPPAWVFGPVWTILFILMGISLFLIWREGTGRPEVRAALLAFGVQLALNILWSALFFGLQSPLLGFLEILLLWGAILATIVLSARVSKPAAWLLLPYLLWVSFAAYLTWAVWTLNP